MNLMTCVKQRARVIQVIIQWIYYSNNEKHKQGKAKDITNDIGAMNTCYCHVRAIAYNNLHVFFCRKVEIYCTWSS